RFPLDERSEDNQLSLLRSKHEVESLIERHVVVESEKIEEVAKDHSSTEDIDIENLLSNKNNFLLFVLLYLY
ncbi:MAG: hypothetical protein ACJ0OP_01680, partial [Thermodesulfobacteriota bacterium]